MSSAVNERPRVKQVVAIAKAWIADVLGTDGLQNVRLEEVRFDDERQVWLVTIGFMRPAVPKRSPPARGGQAHDLAALIDERLLSDEYKLIEIDGRNGDVLAMTTRTFSF